MYHGHTVGIQDTITSLDTRAQINSTITKYTNKVAKIIQKA